MWNWLWKWALRAVVAWFFVAGVWWQFLVIYLLRFGGGLSP